LQLHWKHDEAATWHAKWNDLNCMNIKEWEILSSCWKYYLSILYSNFSKSLINSVLYYFLQINYLSVHFLFDFLSINILFISSCFFNSQTILLLLHHFFLSWLKILQHCLIKFLHLLFLLWMILLILFLMRVLSASQAVQMFFLILNLFHQILFCLKKSEKHNVFCMIQHKLNSLCSDDMILNLKKS